MTWLTLRQFRFAAVAVFALVATVATVLLTIGQPAGSGLTSGESSYYYLGIYALYGLPAVIGAFWGAPLVSRELEAGTHRLVWNQGVTRSRWLVTKMTVLALAAVIATGLLSLVVTWWASTLADGGPADPRIGPAIFGARGVVPVAYAVFAFVLGVAAGVLLRRTVAATAVTLVLFAVVQAGVLTFVRPYLVPPAQEVVPVTADTVSTMFHAGATEPTLYATVPMAESWVLGEETVDEAGNAVDAPAWFGTCLYPAGLDAPPAAAESEGAWRACYTRLADEGYHQEIAHHPDSHFWALQWVETTLYLALAGLLTWFAFFWLRRRVG